MPFRVRLYTVYHNRVELQEKKGVCKSETAGDTVWKTNVTERYCHRAAIGETVLSVFRPGKKRPLLHYDTEGDAC